MEKKVHLRCKDMISKLENSEKKWNIYIKHLFYLLFLILDLI